MFKTSLHYKTFGNKRQTLLMLHGFSQTLQSFEKLGNLLCKEFQVIAVDLPGHGKSTKVGSLNNCLNQLKAFKPDYLLGYSMGARIALHYVSKFPVKKLVLISATPGIKDQSEAKKRLAADKELAKRLRAMSLKDLNVFYQEWMKQEIFKGLTEKQFDINYRSKDPKALSEALITFSQGKLKPLWQNLDKITIPTLLLAGKEDIKYLEIAKSMANLLSQAELVIFKNASHALHLQYPEKTAKVIINFLKQSSY